jgi:hypothetical protein
MKNKKISHIGTLKNPISKSLKDVKSIPLTHKYITVHFLGLVQALQ